jgi:hypothetical protein
MLTKIRLLAQPPVVEAAMNLHMAIHALGAAAERGLQSLADAPDTVWRERNRFLTVARAEMGIRPEVSSVVHAATAG